MSQELWLSPLPPLPFILLQLNTGWFDVRVPAYFTQVVNENYLLK